MTEQTASYSEPLFHVVWSVHPVFEDFFIAGVFSLKQDAEAFACKLRADDRYLKTAKVVEYPMPHIIDILVKERLSYVAELIAPLVKAVSDSTEDARLAEVLGGA